MVLNLVIPVLIHAVVDYIKFLVNFRSSSDTCLEYRFTTSAEGYYKILTLQCKCRVYVAAQYNVLAIGMGKTLLPFTVYSGWRSYHVEIATDERAY